MGTSGLDRPAAAPGFLGLALSPRVVRRALLYAVVVGAVLIAINHGDALLAGDVSGNRLWKMGLTVLVPYTVSTLSSVGALRSVERTDTRGSRQERDPTGYRAP